MSYWPEVEKTAALAIYTWSVLTYIFIYSSSRNTHLRILLMEACTFPLWNWQICHTHQAFKLPLPTFSGKLQTFPTVKSKTIGFLLDWTQQYTPVLFTKTPRELLPEKELLSGHYAAYSEVAGPCYTKWCT